MSEILTVETPESAPETTLLQRLERVERGYRRLRHFGAASFLGTVAAFVVLFTGPARHAPAETVEARRFTLRDAQGHVRGMFGTNQDGVTQFVLQDAGGRPRLRLSVLADGSSGLAVVDSEGRSRAALGLLPDETITLAFADRDGRSRAVLGLTAGQAASLVLADGNGIAGASMSVAANGSTTLSAPMSER
jgi:hypothetical protein